MFVLKKIWETSTFEKFLETLLERASSDIESVMNLYAIAMILGLLLLLTHFVILS